MQGGVVAMERWVQSRGLAVPGGGLLAWRGLAPDARGWAGWAPWLVVLLAGCGGESVLHLPLPPAASGMRSMLVALEQGELLEIHALRLDGDPRLVFPQPAEGEVALTALSYPESLEALGMSEGRVEPASEGDCAPAALPEAAALHRAVIRGGAGAAPSWAPVDRPPARVGAFRRLGPCPCSSWRVVASAEVPLLDAWARAVAPDGRVLLVGTEAGGRARGVLVDGDAIVDVPLAELGISRPRGVLVDAGGTVWIAGEAELWRGDLASGFVSVAGSPDGGRMTAMAGGIGPDGELEVLVMTSSSAVARYQGGGQWASVYQGQALDRGSRQVDLLTWLGPGAVAVAFANALDVVVLRPGQRTIAVQLEAETRGGRALVDVPGFGLVVGTAIGRAFLLADGALRGLGNADLAEVRDGALTPSGFVLGGADGHLHEYAPAFGLCRPQPTPDQMRIRVLMGVGRHLTLFGPALGDRSRGRVAHLEAVSSSP